MPQMGCPILGDVKYGAIKRPLPDKSIALAATAISFKSATDDKTINLEIPLPEELEKVYIVITVGRVIHSPRA